MISYYSVNKNIYELLSKVVDNIQSITVVETLHEVATQHPRMKESKFILTEDVRRINDSVVTAHYLEDYRPSHLKIERLMRESNKLLIDILLNEIGGVRGVPIKST